MHRPFALALAGERGQRVGDKIGVELRATRVERGFSDFARTMARHDV